MLGLYLGIFEDKLRLFWENGELVKTPEEIAEQEQLRADRAQERAEKLAARLKELGVELDM